MNKKIKIIISVILIIVVIGVLVILLTKGKKDTTSDNSSSTKDGLSDSIGKIDNEIQIIFAEKNGTVHLCKPFSDEDIESSIGEDVIASAVSKNSLYLLTSKGIYVAEQNDTELNCKLKSEVNEAFRGIYVDSGSDEQIIYASSDSKLCCFDKDGNIDKTYSVPNITKCIVIDSVIYGVSDGLFFKIGQDENVVFFDSIDEVVDFYVTDDVIYLMSLFGKEDNVSVICGIDKDFNAVLLTTIDGINASFIKTTDDRIYLSSEGYLEKFESDEQSDIKKVCPISVEPVIIDNGYLFAKDDNKICIYDYNGTGMIYEKSCTSSIENIEVVK